MVRPRHAIEDLSEYQSRKGKEQPREVQVGRLERLEKALTNLQYEIDHSLHLMNNFLPNDVLGLIGRSFTFSTIGVALGRDVFPSRLDSIIKSRAIGAPLTMADLENEGLVFGDALGLKHGHEILKHFIDSINRPLKDWIEHDRLNKGGRPADAVRTYLIYRLAEAAPTIIGKSATISTTGKFVELCSLALPACGVSATGIEKAVPSIVKRMRADQAKHPRATG